jgi:hypothetical protein
MAEKSKTDPAAPGDANRPAVQRSPAKAREAAGSAYDSFWHCLSGQHPAGRWPRDRDVAPLRPLRAAFGLAEEKQPIDYGPTGQPGHAAPRTQARGGHARDARARPSGSEEHRGAAPGPRRD